MALSPRDHSARRIAGAVSWLGAVTVVGALGYRALEGWTWSDSFYMVFITLTTVGFGEVHPLSGAGRAWTVVLLAGGIGVVAYTAALAVDFIVEGRMTGLRRRRRMDRRIQSMEDHIIICGYGRVGRQIAEDIRAAGRSFVVVERDEPVHEMADIPHVVGNAEEEATLRAAGIERAAGLVAAVDSDLMNVFITLTAKSLNPAVRVIARAGQPDSVRKLKQVGANRVVSPYTTSAQRMAHLALNPGTVDFYELVSDPSTGLHIQIQQIEVAAGSQLAGHSLRELDLRRSTGVLVVAVRIAARTELNPDPGLVLEAGSILLVLGGREQFEKLESMNQGEILGTAEAEPDAAP
jgi:voltage-gated potassium channel